MKEGELKIGNYFFYIFRAFYTVQNCPLTKSINCVAAETFIAKNWKKLHNARQLQSTAIQLPLTDGLSIKCIIEN